MIEVKFYPTGTVVYSLEALELTEYKVTDVDIKVNPAEEVRYFCEAISKEESIHPKGYWKDSNAVFVDKEELKKTLLDQFN